MAVRSIVCEQFTLSSQLGVGGEARSLSSATQLEYQHTYERVKTFASLYHNTQSLYTYLISSRF